jgi:hypothetical protein
MKYVQMLMVISVTVFQQQLHTFREREHENTQPCAVFCNDVPHFISSYWISPIKLWITGLGGQALVQLVCCVESVCTRSLLFSTISFFMTYRWKIVFVYG